MYVYVYFPSYCKKKKTDRVIREKKRKQEIKHTSKNEIKLSIYNMKKISENA